MNPSLPPRSHSMTTLFGNLLGGRSLRTRPAKIYFVPCSSLFASCLPQDPGAEAFVLSAASIKGQADHRLRPLNHLLLNKKVPPTCNLEEGANFRCCYITLIVYSRTGKPTLKKTSVCSPSFKYLQGYAHLYFNPSTQQRQDRFL